MRPLNITRRILALVILGLTMAPVTPAQKLQLPPHEKVVLKNGLTILLLEKRGVPMVSLAAIVKAGAAADPAGQEGLASITAGLLRKGTKARTAQQFSADLDFMGGSFGADAGADFTSIDAEFLSKDIGHGLELFCDALLRPAFPKEETEKLLAQSLDGVKSSKDSPQSVILEYYDGYLFGRQAYGRPDGGDELSLKRIQRDAIVKFYETYYAPGNTILAVAGEFNAAEMRKKLQEALGAWPAKEAPTITIPSAAQAKGKRLLLVDKPDATQTFFAVGNVGISVTDPDRVAIRVVNTVFGSRFTSLLNEALRVESGLTYGARSFFDGRKEPGPFAMYSYTRNETTTQAMDMMLQVLEKLHKDGLTAEQLASAKSYMKGQFPPSIETSSQLAPLLASHEFYGLDDSEVNQRDERIDGVTLEMARQAIQKHFPAENLVFVLIGKASAIGPAVKKYAEKQDMRAISDPGFWPPAVK